MKNYFWIYSQRSISIGTISSENQIKKIKKEKNLKWNIFTQIFNPWCSFEAKFFITFIINLKNKVSRGSAIKNVNEKYKPKLTIEYTRCNFERAFVIRKSFSFVIKSSELFSDFRKKRNLQIKKVYQIVDFLGDNYIIRLTCSKFCLLRNVFFYPMIR